MISEMVPDDVNSNTRTQSVTEYDQRDWSWESLGQHLVKDDLQQLAGELQREIEQLSQSLDDVEEARVERIRNYLREVQCLIDKIETADDQ